MQLSPNALRLSQIADRQLADKPPAWTFLKCKPRLHQATRSTARLRDKPKERQAKALGT